MNTMKNKATWIVELNADCPNCKEYVNLLDYLEFWDEKYFQLNIAENGTDRSKDVNVVCPECNHDFTVDLEY